MPPASVAWLALGLHLQRHAGELVLTVAQLVAMAALQNQKAATSAFQPAAWMGHITDFVYLKGREQSIGVDLAQLHPHGTGGWSTGTWRTEKPQANSPATKSSSSHSGGTTWGRPRRSSKRIPTSPTAR